MSDLTNTTLTTLSDAELDEVAGGSDINLAAVFVRQTNAAFVNVASLQSNVSGVLIFQRA